MYNFNITKQIEYLDELKKQEGQAMLDHNDLLETTLFDDIARLNKSILTNIICSYSSGTIANIIGDTKYTQIDKAVNKTLQFLFHSEEEQLHYLHVDPVSIAKLIRQCYKAKEIEKDGVLVPDIEIEME